MPVFLRESRRTEPSSYHCVIGTCQGVIERNSITGRAGVPFEGWGKGDEVNPHLYVMTPAGSIDPAQKNTGA